MKSEKINLESIILKEGDRTISGLATKPKTDIGFKYGFIFQLSENTFTELWGIIKVINDSQSSQ